MERADGHISFVCILSTRNSSCVIIITPHFRCICSEDINQIKSSLSILLFDEVIEDVSSSHDVTSGNAFYQKFYNKFLGELIIPFSTIYTSRRVSQTSFIRCTRHDHPHFLQIEGTFEMTTPHILLGYTKPSVALPDPHYLNGNGKLEIRQSILVSLLISIEPIIHLAYSTTSQLECTELSSVKVTWRTNNIQIEISGKSFPNLLSN